MRRMKRKYLTAPALAAPSSPQTQSFQIASPWPTERQISGAAGYRLNNLHWTRSCPQDGRERPAAYRHRPPITGLSGLSNEAAISSFVNVGSRSIGAAFSTTPTSGIGQLGWLAFQSISNAPKRRKDTFATLKFCPIASRRGGISAAATAQMLSAIYFSGTEASPCNHCHQYHHAGHADVEEKKHDIVGNWSAKFQPATVRKKWLDRGSQHN